MTIDFHSQDNRFTYSSRGADVSWINMLNSICDITGKKVLDIGCGGGIYSRALAEMGASFVTGLDFSEQLLSSAKENSRQYSNIHFQLGNALDTGLESEKFDVVLERAVVHHIKDLDTCFNEIYRVLKPNGVCLIQDRTPEDCLLEGSPTHIRGYFFEQYPQLINKEVSRRYSSAKVLQAFEEAGFKESKEYSLWETRKTYKALAELEADLLNRTGRSILHDLSDQQLEYLVSYIGEQLNTKDKIIEKDRWTIWKAIKK
ncbi:SAM-dependent methyltransferase [Bacillus sp. M6-12]|uniref:class I SAM-dependent methyltransferase n=1 Tax=Bacillus sp. M6-12 TaxID=2054166 RepID=UPI000C765CDE|nr:class I SAM-dependent methyltransferase [Bacillus sp. M6-12]PLS14749.1 SAM-dependent methyltransferase [Bacillus sp. M6-12]